jgi:DNA-binding NtrC family response regulator
MQDKRLLWISPEPFKVSEWPLISARYQVETRPMREALWELAQRPAAVVVLDFSTSRWHPAELSELFRALTPRTPIFAHAPGIAPSEAVMLARQGIWQFFSNDEDAVRLIEQAREEAMSQDLVKLAERTSREDWERLLIGESHEMRQVCHIIHVVGGRRSTVLITGETGTGKEMAARSLHMASPRRRGPWVAVNCTALPENLLEAELFGHVKGAFTGAIQSRIGRFEEAQGGTLFLDEIGDLALSLQAKLLRVVQERELQRLGSSETIHLDVRLVAATNCNLAERVEQGRFREDLYYRLNVVPIQMPPLRQRRADIPGLASHFLQKICKLEDLPCKTLTAEAAERLSQYSWPGNVRQLENAVEMAIAFSGDRQRLDSQDFPLPAPARAPAAISGDCPVVSVPEHGMDYEQTLAVIERSILEQALQKTGGNKKAAAAMLGLKRTTLSAKIRSLVTVAACN